MRKYKLILIKLFIIVLFSCDKNEKLANEKPIQEKGVNFSVDNNYILKNNIPFKIKGVVYVPGYPGFLPWEIENSISLPIELKKSISSDITEIKLMGANTIRFWGAPKNM